METAKSKKWYNAIMIFVIVAIIIAAILIVGNLKGWFSSGKSNSFAVLKKSVGITSVSRNGVSFEVDKDYNLNGDDLIKTNNGSNAEIVAGENKYKLNENSEVKIISIDNNLLSINLLSGEVFVTLNDNSTFKQLQIANWTFIANENAVVLFDTQAQTINVTVLEGQVEGKYGQDKVVAKSGQVISIVNNKGSLLPLDIELLNDFSLNNASIVDKSHKLCITNKEIESVINERKLDKGLGGNASININGEIVSENVENTNTTGKASSSKTTFKAEKVTNKQETTLSSNVVSSSKTTTSNNSSNNTTTTTTKKSPDKSKVYHCTIQIRCDTILSNMDNLSPNKEKYVPSDGIILPVTNVEFYEGETAYDVLKRACTSYGIQIEASYTPVYKTYTVKGINNIYEFDCGNESGWMYKVNGWFPNYGCSSYYLKDGDAMVWAYSCNGLGADLK